MSLFNVLLNLFILSIVVKFSQLDDDEKSDSRLIIQLADLTEEKFKGVQSNMESTNK